MRGKLIRFAAVPVVAALLLGGCTTGGADEAESGGEGGTGLPGTVSSEKLRNHAVESLQGKTAAWVPVGLGTPLTEEWTRQMRQGFKALGMEFIVRDPNWDTARQAEAVQSLINQELDVLVVHNFDVQLLAQLIQKAEEQGIHVIQVNMVSNYKSDAFVGVDTIQLGKTIATDIVKACGKGTSGKVQIVKGDATSGFTLDVMAGAKSVFKEHPNISVVSEQAANWDRTKAHDITATVIQQHPDLCASWGFWDQMQYGAATAIQQAGKLDQVNVFTSDHSALTCQAIRDGLFDKAIAYDVPGQGKSIVTAAQYLLQSGQEPGAARTALFSRTYPIDKSNYKNPGMCYDGKTDGFTLG